MFNPVPKPVKKEKKVKTWCKTSKPKKTKNKKEPNKYRCSNGDLFTDAQITNRLSKAYKDDESSLGVACECCGVNKAVDHDHTISQRRCKVLKKTELIWDSLNWSYSCRKCHTEEWESYKNGKFVSHNNFSSRMEMLREHDPESYRKRMNYVMDKNPFKK